LSNFSINFVVAVPKCETIHGVGQGETCSSIIQKFNLLQVHFLEINPNINCVGIFVGQWVCVEGELNWVVTLANCILVLDISPME
jgi:hypothetical protein